MLDVFSWLEQTYGKYTDRHTIEDQFRMYEFGMTRDEVDMIIIALYKISNNNSLRLEFPKMFKIFPAKYEEPDYD